MKKPLFTQFPVTSHTDFITPGGTFVVIKGQKDDGVHYIAQALERGAKKIVIENDTQLDQVTLDLLKNNNATLERVENSRKALAFLSAQAADNPAKSLKIFGVTGTKGKTTTSWMLAHMLKTLGKKVACLTTAQIMFATGNPADTFDEYELTAPLTTPQPDYLHQFLKLCVDKGIEYVVLEVAAQAMTFNRIDGIMFDGIIFTNLDREHGELYPSMELYFKEKQKLFDYAKADAAILINNDDEYGKRLIQLIPHAKSFGLYTQGAFRHTKDDHDYYDLAGLATHNGAVIEDTIPEQKVFIGDAQGDNQLTFTYHGFPGAYNFYNFLGGISLLSEKGFDLTPLSTNSIEIAPIPGRLQFFRLPNKAIACIDYAHTAASFEAVLTTMREFASHLIVVFGAGGGKDSFKRSLMGRAAGKLADYVVITDDNPRDEDPKKITKQILDGVKPKHKSKVIVEHDRYLAVLKAYYESRAGSIIMLLGKGVDEGQMIKGVNHEYSDKEALSLIWQMTAFAQKTPLEELVKKFELETEFESDLEDKSLKQPAQSDLSEPTTPNK